MYRKLIVGRVTAGGYRCSASWCDLGLTFNLGCTRMFSSAILETYFPNHKDMWIAVTDYYMCVYLGVLSPLTAFHE